MIGYTLTRLNIYGGKEVRREKVLIEVAVSVITAVRPGKLMYVAVYGIATWSNDEMTNSCPIVTRGDGVMVLMLLNAALTWVTTVATKVVLKEFWFTLVVLMAVWVVSRVAKVVDL